MPWKIGQPDQTLGGYRERRGVKGEKSNRRRLCLKGGSLFRYKEWMAMEDSGVRFEDSSGLWPLF